MSQAFSTEQLAIADRSLGWQGKAREICGDCRVQFPKHYPFHGSIDVRRLGSLELMRFASSALAFTEFPSQRPYGKTYCIVATQMEGVRCYSQDGHAAVLEPGDSTLIDGARPWSSEASGKSVRLYFRMPRELLTSRLRSTSFPIARRIAGNHGLGAVLFQLATSLFHEAETFKPVESMAALDSYLDILSGCLGRCDKEFGAQQTSVLLSEVLGFIETHLAEPSLVPSSIASELGISVRHLHRLFARHGDSPADWIRQRRLEKSRTDLADVRFRDRTITEIAFLWGFSDSAHFSRSFRKQFGISPRAFRAGAGRKYWRAAEREDPEMLLRTRLDLPYPKPN